MNRLFSLLSVLVISLPAYTQFCPPLILTQTTTNCIFDSIQLNASAGYATYTWTPPNGLSNPNISNPLAAPTTTTTYTVIATTPAGGGSNLIFNSDFSLGNTGFTSDLNYTTTYSPCNYYVAPTWFTWTDPTLIDNTPTSDGMYMSIDGCTTSGILWETTLPVNSFTNYDFSFWATRADQIQPIFEIHFIGNVSGDNIVATLNDIPYTGVWTWDMYSVPIWNSGSNTSLTIRIVNLETNGYGNDFGFDDFDFHANDTADCADTASITITAVMPVTNVKYTIPNVFTPNNDGINDEFWVQNAEIVRGEIYNRWGELVYELSVSNTTWNGTNTLGKPVVDGVYFYVIQGKSLCDNEWTETGFIHLMR